MNLIDQIKNRFETLKKRLTLKESLYMDPGASLVCSDKDGEYTKSVNIVASHINPDLDNPSDYPEFIVVKSSSKDGYIGTYKKFVLTLDADNEPTEGSNKLLTSGLLYEIINDLQNQINELKSTR